MAKVLIIAEHDGSALNPSTAKCVACADGIDGAEIDVVVFAADAAAIAGEAASLDSALFTLPMLSNRPRILTATDFRNRLCQKLALAVPSEKNFSTHSLRRGGATWLLAAGTPLAAIKAIGDWSSDAVFKYLTPDIGNRFDTLFKACSTLPHLHLNKFPLHYLYWNWDIVNLYI